MPIYQFPNAQDAGEDGLLAIGGDYHPDSLRLAYKMGIFPWPIEGYPITWFCPKERGVLFFKNLRINRTLTKFLNKNSYRISINENFEKVIQLCSEVSRPRSHPDMVPGTWITQDLKNAYIEFHRLGHAHSVEVWEGDQIIGGLYGVCVEGVFAGESMFHFKPNASKLALIFLIEILKKQKVEWIDIQQLTPHMESLGAINLSRNNFLSLLKSTQQLKLQITL